MSNNQAISTHAPHARRGNSTRSVLSPQKNFYSRASCEARLFLPSISIDSNRFLLTRLMRGAAVFSLHRLNTNKNFYSRASCEARLDFTSRISSNIDISTHAPHARRGLERAITRFEEHNFYSRASCEARPFPQTHPSAPLAFLLTRLMRGAAPFSNFL